MKRAFELLGILPGSDPRTVRKAWRTLVRTYHPDQVRTNKSEADRRLAEINAAFDLVSAWTPDPSFAQREHAAAQQQKAQAEAQKRAEEAAKAAADETARKTAARARAAEAARKAADAARARAKTADRAGEETAQRNSYRAPRRNAVSCRVVDPCARQAQALFEETLKWVSSTTRPKHIAFA